MIVNAVKSTYPGIPIYFEAVALTVAERGYTETIYGFKRLLPLINSHDKWARDSAKRMAANTPIQGSAADIMKRSQNAIYEKIGEDTQGLRYGWKTEEEAFMVHGHVDQVAQIHDEVILEIDDVRSLVERVHAWVKLTMEKEPLPNFPVPLIAEGSVAYQWGTKTGFDTWLEQKGA
jgi:DNA polymerase-1